METTHQDLTFITVGTGKTGRRVAERLAAADMPVRIGSRSGAPPFDWEDASTWASALSGVHAVYLVYYPDLASPVAAEAIGRFLDLAIEAGVQRVVLLSGRGEPDAERSERVVVDKSRAAGIAWTVVRASVFAQDFSEFFLLDPVRSGVVAFPGGNVKEPFVDVDDIADVVTAALTLPGHDGQLYDVTGPRMLTFAEAVSEISATIGRKVEYVPVSAEDYASALLAQVGLPAETAAAFRELFETIFDGRNESVGDGAERALGRRATDFADYVRKAAATGVWNV
jgi:uncharacterized protein YbjT (DUF2867 family)